MNQELSNNNMNLQKLFDEQKKVIGKMAKEVAEREFEIFELNLFVSSMGEKRLNSASKDVQEIRNLVDTCKINLKEFEDLAEEF